MALKKSELYSSLWKSCDELRGGMDASQYKDYVLVLLFFKYVSDKYAGDPSALIDVPAGGTLMQLRFASFAVINLRRDLHPQECARAGRTRKRPPGWGGRSVCQPPVTWPACLNPKCWRTGSRSRRTAEFPDPRRRLAWHRCPTSS